jgi:hypothetical protein
VTPWSLAEVNRRFVSFLFVATLSYSSTLKIGAADWRETFVTFYKTTRRHIPEAATIFKCTALRIPNFTESEILMVLNVMGPIHDQSCCATLRVVQHDWPCMVLIDLIVTGQTCVAQNNFAQHD